MRTILAMLALAMCLLGCDALTQSDRIEVRTSGADVADGQCFLAGVAAELVLEPGIGLAWKVGPGDIRSIIWPRGYTARRSGSEIQVMNSEGRVIARSGTKAEFSFVKFEPGVVYGC